MFGRKSFSSYVSLTLQQSDDANVTNTDSEVDERGQISFEAEPETMVQGGAADKKTSQPSSTALLSQKIIKLEDEREVMKASLFKVN